MNGDEDSIFSNLPPRPGEAPTNAWNQRPSGMPYDPTNLQATPSPDDQLFDKSPGTWRGDAPPAWQATPSMRAPIEDQRGQSFLREFMLRRETPSAYGLSIYPPSMGGIPTEDQLNQVATGNVGLAGYGGEDPGAYRASFRSGQPARYRPPPAPLYGPQLPPPYVRPPGLFMPGDPRYRPMPSPSGPHPRSGAGPDPRSYTLGDPSSLNVIGPLGYGNNF